MFTELVVSNITRLIDLPGTELAQLMGEEDLKLAGGNTFSAGSMAPMDLGRFHWGKKMPS